MYKQISVNQASRVVLDHFKRTFKNIDINECEIHVEVSNHNCDYYKIFLPVYVQTKEAGEKIEFESKAIINYMYEPQENALVCHENTDDPIVGCVVLRPNSVFAKPVACRTVDRFHKYYKNR